MTLMILLAPGLILLAMMLFVLTGLESGVRRLGVFALAGAAFACGMVAEKAVFVNRHIAMCMDDTAATYRATHRFDPYCEVLSRGQ
jgi:hypothetical protein